MKTHPQQPLCLLTAMVALCGISHPVWAQTTNTVLPVYQVVQSGMTAVQARSLADTLNISYKQLVLSNGLASFIDTSSFMTVPSAPVTDDRVISNLLATTENPIPDVPIRFEQIDFDALAKLTVPDQEVALKLVSDALSKSELTPQFGKPTIEHTIFQAYYTNANNIVISNSQALDTRVDYQFTLPGGQALVGPGAQVHLTFGPDGKITQLHYAARQLKQGAKVQLISPKEAVQRVAALFPSGAKIEEQLVYWAPPFWWQWPDASSNAPPRWKVSTILPWYQFTATTQVTNPFTGEVTPLQQLTQLLPATDDPEFVPAVKLAASTVGGTQVVANVTVTGGASPYSYQWSGSAPDVAENEGTKISYTPEVSVSPPQLKASFEGPGSVKIEWPADPTPKPWFVLESTPSLTRSSWTLVKETVVTSNGLSSVTLKRGTAAASFFRLRMMDPPLLADEAVRVVVTDANGVQVQASQTVSVEIVPVEKTGNPVVVPKIVGKVDWGTESPYDPGLGVADRTSWTTGMILGGGGVQRFLWTGHLSWKKDFVEAPAGINDYQVDNADIVLYIGHGNPVVFTFTGGPGPSPTTLFFNDALQAWGDVDQEWLCLLSCDVLHFNNSNGNVWQRWGPDFNGLHILTGFRSSAGAGTGFPFEFTQNMLGLFGFLRPPMPIVNAWFAAAHARGTGSPAAMGPIGPGGVYDFGDYYWGKGSVGPTIRASQIRGWWYAQ